MYIQQHTSQPLQRGNPTHAITQMEFKATVLCEVDSEEKCMNPHVCMCVCANVLVCVIQSSEPLEGLGRGWPGGWGATV